MVVVSGDSNAAYLMDTADVPPAFDPVYLGSGVSDVQFQTDDQGQLTIATVLDDGAMNLFDQNGKPTGQVLFSPDRTRKVDISGDNQDAYLYDTSDSPAFDPVYLNSQAVAVQFQSDEDGQLVVLILNQDGSTNSYDSSGTFIDSQPAPQSDPVPATDDQGDGSSTSSVGQGLGKSASFNSLKTGAISW